MSDPHEPAETFCCPVCGFRDLRQPAYERLPAPPFPDLGDPPYDDRYGAYSHDMCACCGYEFGYDDVDAACGTASSFADYRRAWLAGGARWYSVGSPPAGWDVTAQLKEAGLS